MTILLEQSARLLANTRMDFRRYLNEKINWNERLIGIKGARGIGKTTLLLQHLKKLDLPKNKAAYFSLDDLYFTSSTLKDTGDQFYKEGGRVLVLDEVHKYPEWAREVKNLHDFFPDLQIVFTGSSIIDLSKEVGDLSRRAILYDLAGLSYREYLEMKKVITLPALTFEQLLAEKQVVSIEIMKLGFRPLEYLEDYMRFGYYPFGVNMPDTLYQRLNQVVRTIVESDMSAIPTFNLRNARKLLQLIEVIARQVPFKPNISELADKTQLHRNSINAYLHYLEQAKIISLLQPAGISTALLQKPEKIYLQNTSMLHALANNQYQSGTVRETFVQAMLSVNHRLSIPVYGDFLVDDQFTLEIGGVSKGKKQIREIPNAWVVKDGIETGSSNIVPLWLFGLLY